ncbi:hypothetical protein B0H13DRAFT_1932154 [Mycena leptocephala]|nr:hypothetical protein B0H13DRAFT_1932154 [Mycena leptocephala]
MFGACPPLLADIEMSGLYMPLPTPKPSVDAGVTWWKDYIEGITERFMMQVDVYAKHGALFASCCLVKKEVLTKKVDDAYNEHILVAAQLIAVISFCRNLAGTVSLHRLKRLVSPRMSIIVGALSMVLKQVMASHQVVNEMHANVVEHWLFLLTELEHQLSGEGCVCEVVGTDRPLEWERKHVEIRLGYATDPRIASSLAPHQAPENFLKSYSIMVISAPANCAHPHRINDGPGKVHHPVVFTSIACSNVACIKPEQLQDSGASLTVTVVLPLERSPPVVSIPAAIKPILCTADLCCRTGHLVQLPSPMSISMDTSGACTFVLTSHAAAAIRAAGFRSSWEPKDKVTAMNQYAPANKRLILADVAHISKLAPPATACIPEYSITALDTTNLVQSNAKGLKRNQDVLAESLVGTCNDLLLTLDSALPFSSRSLSLHPKIVPLMTPLLVVAGTKDLCIGYPAASILFVDGTTVEIGGERGGQRYGQGQVAKSAGPEATAVTANQQLTSSCKQVLTNGMSLILEAGHSSKSEPLAPALVINEPAVKLGGLYNLGPQFLTVESSGSVEDDKDVLCNAQVGGWSLRDRGRHPAMHLQTISLFNT